MLNKANELDDRMRAFAHGEQTRDMMALARESASVLYFGGAKKWVDKLLEAPEVPNVHILHKFYSRVINRDLTSDNSSGGWTQHKAALKELHPGYKPDKEDKQMYFQKVKSLQDRWNMQKKMLAAELKVVEKMDNELSTAIKKHYNAIKSRK
jgi:hypothetical protein